MPKYSQGFRMGTLGTLTLRKTPRLTVKSVAGWRLIKPMIVGKDTGRLKWVRDRVVWNLIEEVRRGYPVYRIDWGYTGWWVFWWAPLPVFDVMCVDKTVKRFWRLKSAKAYAEIMHRMELEP